MADTIEQLKHDIIEEAKVAFKDDQSIPFVRHLEMAARTIAPGFWCETYVSRGVWHFNLATSAPRISNEEGPLL